MNKIPTLFVRDPDDRKHVIDEVTPGCEWVLDGEGRATRKYDGTCVMFDGEAWWARREVKPGKQPPPNYVPISTDEVTGKTMGWEPIEQSSHAASHAEVMETKWYLPFYELLPGTFELIGPKVNGNPEGATTACAIRHGYEAYNDRVIVEAVPLTFAGLAEYLPTLDWEGVVWHHPDGRMAKLKRRDFPPASPQENQ